ncbi:RCC1 domain protein [Phytophthora cinnamomi]|uniref:RCC1 domain protein n=1 Tax=Phytophthora cinnamomi TaxID=4785 RepID=UPI00355A816A|nr:RCC1 domain protein [Phytophthora cinnamomi]
MGQQVSLPAAVTQPPGEHAQLRPLQAPYVPLCDVLKAGDSAVASTAAEDTKDAMDKILEFGAALCYLPKESEVSGRLQTRSPEQQLKELMSPVDTVDELFQHISQLAGLPSQDPQDGKRDVVETMPGIFDARVAAYVKSLQALYQMIKKEKYRHEQRLLAARTHAMSLRKVSPPPLPLPTQNCMTMGWDLVVMLLKATRRTSPDQYEQALQMVKDNLKPLKPTAYTDSMYLAPSASSAFNLLCDCLGELAYPVNEDAPEGEMHIGARTIETLAEVGLARGSLATMLFVVLWLMKQPPTSTVNLETSIAKLAALKEQPMYGKCEASGELYSCGQNSYGELGTGDDIERHQLTSVALCGWDDIRQVVSGNETLAVLTNEGVVLTCGLNKSGQCGQGHFDERVMMLRPVQALRSQRVKFIAASNGCEHMIALTDTGVAYSWGYNDRGQLGHENLATKIHVPKLIESLKDKKLGYASATDPHIAFFWDVLGEFSDEQKSYFLRFVWGRSRLPTHAADFTQDFKISGLPKAAGRADMYLPIAHTCFFSIDLPAYSCREVMHDKLVYAITHCQSIDADNTTVAQRAGQGINWTNAAATATATATAAVSSVIAGMATIVGE